MWDVEDFRALARSSPWLWRSIRLVREEHNDWALPTVRAWIRRPQALRVETLEGEFLTATPGRPRPTNVSILTSGASDEEGAPPHTEIVWWTDPRVQTPQLRGDGLVAAPYDGWQDVGGRQLLVEVEDPMWQNYRWVAMLNPREFADGAEGGPGVAIDSIELVERKGRATVLATVKPLDDYDPRCSCCPLLPSRQAALAEGFPDADGEFAEAHWVALDVATGICVSAREVGGPHHGWGHEVTIEAVDDDLPDALFEPEGSSRGRLRRAWLGRQGPAGWAAVPGRVDQ